MRTFELNSLECYHGKHILISFSWHTCSIQIVNSDITEELISIVIQTF